VSRTRPPANGRNHATSYPVRPAARSPDRAVAVGAAQAPPRDKGFAESLLRQAPNLSAPQWSYVTKLVDRVKNPAKPIEIESFGGVVELLDRAAQRLKYPKLLALIDGKKYRLTIAGELARAPGSINITDTRTGEDRTWFGRISREGVFEPSHKITQATTTAITAALRALAADPAAVAKAYGVETGACCFCGLELTDKRSVDAGYGPICAEKWGLPWGAP
jgi:hypothetical protein